MEDETVLSPAPSVGGRFLRWCGVKFAFWDQPGAPELEARLSIPEIWSDERGIAIRGWILTPGGPPDHLELINDEELVPVENGTHGRRLWRNKGYSEPLPI